MNLPWFDLEHIIVGMLIMLRVGTLIILLPVIGHQLVPPQVKIGIIVLLSLLLYPVVSQNVPLIPLEPIALGIAAVREILMAGMLALLAQLIFAAAQFAGQIMSFQMGMTVANVFDPATSSQISVISQLAITLAMLIWLTSGAHRIFIQGLSESFALLPVGQTWNIEGMHDLTRAAASLFVLALKIAAPVMILLTLVYAALGLLTRAVPQIQVFFVSFPITVGLGLLTLSLAIPTIIYLLGDAFSGLENRMALLLKHIAGN